jgi:hypothetical protein
LSHDLKVPSPNKLKRTGIISLNEKGAGAFTFAAAGIHIDTIGMNQVNKGNKIKFNANAIPQTHATNGRHPALYNDEVFLTFLVGTVFKNPISFLNPLF